MRIFLDANILFSASKSTGAIHELLMTLLKANHECWADVYVIEEARRNLVAKDQQKIPVLDKLVMRLHVAHAHPHASTLKILQALPEKDRPVLDAAIRLRCDVLVTGDKTHFGQFYGKTIEGVTVHSPRSLAETILN